MDEPPNAAEVFLIGSTLSELREAVRKKVWLVRMEYTKEDGRDVYRFETLKRHQVQALPIEEKERLERARPLVRKVIADRQRELGDLARAYGLEWALFGRRGFGRPRPTYRLHAPTPLSTGFKLSGEKKYFETFADGRSVRMIFVPFETDRRKH